MNDEPLILIPGLGNTPRLFTAQVERLARSRPVVIADHTSHDDMVALGAALLDRAPPRFAIAGFSMGGYVALEVMRQAPDRVLRLALMDTQAIPDNADMRAARERLIALAEGGRFDEVTDILLPRLLAPAHVGDQALAAIIRDMADGIGPEAFVRQLRAIMSRVDQRSNLAAIRCPTLVLVGEHDVITTPERAREMHEGISGSRLVVVPGSGHMTPIEAPEAVTAALETWLA